MIKGVPVTELVLVAVSVRCGEYGAENGQLYSEYVLDVLDKDWYEKLGSPSAPRRAVVCSCCGHSLKVAYLVAHKPTSELHWVGRDCARKIDNFIRFFGTRAESVTVALGERILADKREAEFVKKVPNAALLLAYARKPHANRITKDMLEKLRRYDSGLSDKQVALWTKIQVEDDEQRAQTTATAPKGRQTVSGYVLSVKEVRDTFSRYGGTITKVLVDLGNGTKVYGNLPSGAAATKGQYVEFTATFEPSEKDLLFGFWKRPTKFSVKSLVLPKPVVEHLVLAALEEADSAPKV